MEQNLIEKAIKARLRAYAPYSNFRVGAAVLTIDGSVYTGCNIENASYGLTLCAERVAIFKAVSDGKHDIKTVVIAADTSGPVVPCGACLQVMAEFNVKEIVMVNLSGNKINMSLKEMLPLAFTNKDLGGGKI